MSEDRYAYGTLALTQFPIQTKDEFQSFTQRNLAL